MKNCYEAAFDELTSLIEASRDKSVQLTEGYEKSIGDILSLGDSRFASYSSIVKTNKLRAAKVIENLAVSLFEAKKNKSFSLYPIDSYYRKLNPTEQKKTRPFQIILNEDGKKIGVVFCSFEDTGYYSQHLILGNYSVDSLRLVLLSDPDEFAYETLIKSVNNFNQNVSALIERWTIREFWQKYFGDEEFERLISHINSFNERAKEIVGFNTVVTPTDTALKKFRATAGEMLCSFPYKEAIPDSVFERQIDIFYGNYIGRGLWRAMVGESNFAISFITSEWNYQMYKMTENLDLTSVVTGYIKSIEQLIWVIIELHNQKNFRIYSKSRKLIEFSLENESIIDSTLGSLEGVIKHNSWMLVVNHFAKKYIVETIEQWRQKYRNGYFHKENLQSIRKARDIRNQAIQLYFLILGGFEIKDQDFTKLGII